MMKNIRNKSVLVIDDDRGLLRALEKVLHGEGAHVICAEEAGEAIEFLARRKVRIDLVITDLQMPLLSGVTVVYALHRICPATPVIVLTAFGGPELKAECFQEGAAAFLEKPLDTPQLLAAIKGVLARQKTDSANHDTQHIKKEITNENIKA